MATFTAAMYHAMKQRSINLTEKQQKEFGQYLRKHRQAVGINQAEAGRLAGMSRTQWTRLELGESGTRRENIPQIAKAIKADLHETYRKAGYSPPSEELYMPVMIEDFNYLPKNVQEDVAVIIKALRQKYGLHKPKASRSL